MWLYIKKALEIAILCGTISFGQSLFPETKVSLKGDSLNFGEIKINREATYIGDFTSNLAGGNRKGTAYLGIANLRIGFETANIGLWKNGEFFINGAATHGATPSSKLFGDFQVASNIEAGNHIFIQELWYKHSFGTNELILGLQDLNAEFVTSDYSRNFINSSFGIPSLIAENLPVPIFPLTALGVTTKINISDNLVLKTAVFDGLPDGFEDNQYNINWKLNTRNGIQLFSEFQVVTSLYDLPGSVKVGTYFHSHLIETNETTGVAETVFEKNYGFYLIADQTLWQKGDNSYVGFFTQLAVSPGNINLHNYYVGAGMSCTGFFGNDCDNSLGIAFAHAGMNSTSLKSETVVEVFYRSILMENFFIQPDFQYIINPAGSGKNLNNALAAFVRFGINF